SRDFFDFRGSLRSAAQADGALDRALTSEPARCILVSENRTRLLDGRHRFRLRVLVGGLCNYGSTLCFAEEPGVGPEPHGHVTGIFPPAQGAREDHCGGLAHRLLRPAKFCHDKRSDELIYTRGAVAGPVATTYL
ncbi:MAG TPA: hypothetical protein VEG60_04465, partial [Candidatus Binatia bacterium]|nr:hypothetical protein [Candidatus Binatia bacterium]